MARSRDLAVRVRLQAIRMVAWSATEVAEAVEQIRRS